MTHGNNVKLIETLQEITEVASEYGELLSLPYFTRYIDLYRQYLVDDEDRSRNLSSTEQILNFEQFVDDDSALGRAARSAASSYQEFVEPPVSISSLRQSDSENPMHE